MNNFFLKPKKAKGFTLVEVLVSMSIFILAVSMGVLSVVSMSSASKKVLIRDQTMQSAYFLMDSLSRSIRMGKDYDCITTSGTSTPCTSTLAAGLSYTDQDGVNVKLTFRMLTADYGVFYRNINNAGEIKLHDEYSLKLKSAGFMVDGVGNTDTVQPFVIIRMLATYDYKGTTFNVPIQTTLTQREIDVPTV